MISEPCVCACDCVCVCVRACVCVCACACPSETNLLYTHTCGSIGPGQAGGRTGQQGLGVGAGGVYKCSQQKKYQTCNSLDARLGGESVCISCTCFARTACIWSGEGSGLGQGQGRGGAKPKVDGQPSSSLPLLLAQCLVLVDFAAPGLICILCTIFPLVRTDNSPKLLFTG